MRYCQILHWYWVGKYVGNRLNARRIWASTPQIAD